MSFRLIDSKTVELTPKLAKEFQNMKPSPTERSLDKSRLKYLHTKAEERVLIPFNWASAKLGDDEYRVNGQTSSHMLCELNGGFPKGLTAHLDRYEVDQKEDLAELFRQFDPRKSSRSAADVAAAYQGLVEELDETPRPTAKIGMDGIIWYNRQVIGAPVVQDDRRYSGFNDVNTHPFLIWFGELINASTPELKKTPVVAAIFGSFIANPDVAKIFWAGVANGGDEYEKNDPAHTLDEWLQYLAIEKPKAIKPAHVYQGCIYAWNAVRDGKMISNIRYDTKKGYLDIRE